MRNTTIFRKSAASIFAVLLLMLTIFSSVYIITESEHDCEGEDCAICHMIEICEGILHNTGKVLSFCIIAAFIHCISEFLQIIKSNLSFKRTLFDLKVRLNN